MPEAGNAADLAEAAEAHRAGRSAEAVVILRRATRRNPDRYEAFALLGQVLLDLRDHAAAAETFARATELAPAAPGLASALALSLKALGRAREAIPALERALAVDPADAEILANLGGLYRETGRATEAVELLQRAVASRPDWAPAYNNLGNALLAIGKAEEAVAALERARQLEPARASILCNLGVAYKNAGRLARAIAAEREAIRKDPAFSDAHLNLGDALLAAGDVAGAVEAFRKAAALAPGNPTALANVVFALDYDERSSQADMAAARREWADRFAAPLALSNRQQPLDPDPDRRLRVGYVSAGFARGSVGSIVVPLIVGHDPKKVQVVCYSDTQRLDGVAERLKRTALWRDIRGMTDAALADAVRDDRIDILVDLSAHMAGSRLLAFARRPAPVQVTGWGNAVGTGLAAMDWFMADRTVVPEGDERFHAEAIWRLSSWLCFEPPSDFPEPPTRGRRTESGVIFGYFNRLSKLSSASIGAWCRILRELPSARMMLKYRGLDDPGIRAPFVRAFADGGIGEERLEFRGASGQGDHLQAVGSVDIVLDPFPHGGGVTALEGLWMGAPPIALSAPRPSGRTTASLLTSIGAPELIATSVDEYVAIARDLALNPKRLAEYQTSLGRRLAASVVMDMPRYVAEVEDAYRAMWRRALFRPGGR
jgi:predicted O-linked N-acetylglucosamine transferase (SPINDLY family)